jgi:hypothetical protein
MLTHERSDTMTPADDFKDGPTATSNPRRRALIALLLGGGAAAFVARSWAAAGDGRQVTLYKEPQCDCCEGYADYLRRSGFTVTVVPTHDLPLLDEKFGIPPELAPCHVALVSGYVVGGHVPIEVVNKLLAEKPKITGITLPGMPPGSPGMTGEKAGPFDIFEITKKPYKLYAVV